ncbi:uncharacterized protein LOC127285381 [Leptopilina boulardi]|uniref:uncharacterized protein LOC127285381 n=1 Tax=Leptopilina boulardi TaxID=63433 RepID=UPI0021F543FF|nr:uncharacterized protein LOC127285381 [Leptopilina boulardi]
MLDPEFRNFTTKWKKQSIIDWLIRRGVAIPTNVESFNKMKRDELYKLSQEHRYPKIYLLETITKELRGNDVKLLWMPVAYCELNPIELIWAHLKRQVATNNKTFKINDVLELCKEQMNTVPSSLWLNCARHAREIEDQYRGQHNDVDRFISPLIINVGAEDSDTDDEEFDIQDDVLVSAEFEGV